MVKLCNKHELPKNTSGKCRICNTEAVTKSRRKIKSILVTEHGGKCIRCDYDKCIAALHFHHRDPATKLFRVGGTNIKSLKRNREEAKKCDLLCANCHAEEHYGSLA